MHTKKLRPRNLLTAVLFLFACGSGVSSDPTDPITFDNQLERFITANCDHSMICLGSTDRSRCENEIRSDMESARAKLDDSGKQQCAACMNVKSTTLQSIIHDSCPSVKDVDLTAIHEACGPNGDEACAGYP